MKTYDPREELARVVKVSGSQRAAALYLGISSPYVSDLLAGRRHFSEAMLTKLGLQRIVVIMGGKLGGRPKKAAV